MMVFLLLNSQIIANFRNFENHMKDYREKELLAAQKINDIQKKVIRNIAGVIEARDTFTGEHTERTTGYVEEICRELVREGIHTDVLDEETITRIVQSAALHDIGKIMTPDAVLVMDYWLYSHRTFLSACVTNARDFASKKDRCPSRFSNSSLF